MRRFASLVVVALASCGPIQSGQVADQINAEGLQIHRKKWLPRPPRPAEGVHVACDGPDLGLGAVFRPLDLIDNTAVAVAAIGDGR